MRKWENYLLLVLILPALWVVLPTNVFIRQAELRIDGTEVYFARQTPFGTVNAEWRSEIVVLDGTDFECRSGAWQQAVYQSRKSNAATYTIGDWALPCLERGSNYTITTTRRVVLWGWLKMRPSTQVDLIEVIE